MAKKDKNAPVQNKESAMSEIYKKFKQNPALYIGSVFILLLVTVTFIGGDFLSGGGMGGRGGDLTFGYYDKVPISWVPGNMFAQNQEQAVRYYQSMGYDLSNFTIAAQIWRQSYDMTISHIAILQMMKRSNFSMPEKTVDSEVARLPQFLVNGIFSSALYNQLSESAQAALWRQVQDELIKMTFFNDLFYGMLVPSAEAEFIGNMASMMRRFEMVSFSIDEFPESDYLDYAYENAGLFGTIHLSMISVSSSEREARRILDSIINGSTTFEDAARAHSVDNYSDRGGDVGSRHYYDLDWEIPSPVDRDRIFRLGRGEISEIFRINDRWVFFRVEEELKHADFNDASVMDRVRSHMRNYNRGRMEDLAIIRAREFIAEAQVSGFEDAVRWRNMSKVEFGPLPINHGSVDLFTSLESFSLPGFSEYDLEFMANNENFWRTAFSTQLNTLSEPLVQGNYVLILVPVEQINERSHAVDSASMYSSYWLNLISEQSLHYYFRTNERMDDRFWDTYFTYFIP